MTSTKQKINEVDSEQYTLADKDSVEMTRALRADMLAIPMQDWAQLPITDKGVTYRSVLVERNRDFAVFQDENPIRRRVVVNLRSGRIKVWHFDPVDVPERLKDLAFRDEIGDLVRNLRNVKVGDSVSVEITNWECYDMQIVQIEENGWMTLERTLPRGKIRRCFVNKVTGAAYDDGNIVCDRAKAENPEQPYMYRVRYLGPRKWLERRNARASRWHKQRALRDSIVNDIRCWLVEHGTRYAWTEERVNAYLTEHVYSRSRLLSYSEHGYVSKAIDDMRRHRERMTFSSLVRPDNIRILSHQMPESVDEYRTLAHYAAVFVFYHGTVDIGRFIMLPVRQEDRQAELASGRLTQEDIDLVEKGLRGRFLTQLRPQDNHRFALLEPTTWEPPAAMRAAYKAKNEQDQKSEANQLASQTAGAEVSLQ
jgi:hypothetical protein